VDRKPKTDKVPAVCACGPPDGNEVGCGPQCLNRYMYYECTDECPTGSKCSNRRFQSASTELLTSVSVKRVIFN
jgi:histone-lysine N-methyltransferase SETD2